MTLLDPITVVCLESPYRSSDVYSREQHRDYYFLCLEDCAKRDEAAFSGHFHFTEILDDEDPRERAHGFAMHFALMQKCDKVVVYSDFGVSPGMKEGMAEAKKLGKPIEWRKIEDFERVNKIKGL